MTPQKDQHVKCFMRSSMILEGIVEEWSEKEIVLKSLDGDSIMIVHHPAEDVILTKIIINNSAEKPTQELPKIAGQIAEKLKDIIQSNENPEINKLNLDQLRILSKRQDAKIIAEKKKEHFGEIGNVKMPEYSNPILKRK